MPNMRYTSALWRIFFSALLALGSLAVAFAGEEEPRKPVPGVINEITPEEFAALIFDWREGGDFRYAGTKPAVVDFYATWCVPCRVLRPRLKELAKKYKDEIVVYSIDAEMAPNLSYLMGVQAYPTILFIPLKETPTIAVGLLPQKDLNRGVEELLLGRKAASNE